MLKVTFERKLGLFDANAIRSFKSVILTSYVIVKLQLEMKLLVDVKLSKIVF